MPKYQVRITETAAYTLTVEAEDEDDALEAAEEMFVQAEDANAYFSHVCERSGEVLFAETEGATNV